MATERPDPDILGILLAIVRSAEELGELVALPPTASDAEAVQKLAVLLVDRQARDRARRAAWMLVQAAAALRGKGL